MGKQPTTSTSTETDAERVIRKARKKAKKEKKNSKQEAKMMKKEKKKKKKKKEQEMMVDVVATDASDHNNNNNDTNINNTNTNTNTSKNSMIEGLPPAFYNNNKDEEEGVNNSNNNSNNNNNCTGKAEEYHQLHKQQQQQDEVKEDPKSIPTTANNDDTDTNKTTNTVDDPPPSPTPVSIDADADADAKADADAGTKIGDGVSTDPAAASVDVVVGKKKRKRKRKRKVDKEEDNAAADDDDNGDAAAVINQGPNPLVQDTIFVEGIPFDVTEQHVRDFFEKTHATLNISDIIELRLPTWQDSGRLRGFGHIKFASSESYHKALTLNRKYMGRRYLTIQPAKGSSSTTSTGEVGIGGTRSGMSIEDSVLVKIKNPPDKCTTIYVNNLPYTASEEDIYDAFLAHTPSLKINTESAESEQGVRIARNSVTRLSKGFAYLDLVSPKETQKLMKAAIKKNVIVGSRIVRLDYDTGRMKGSFRK